MHPLFRKGEKDLLKKLRKQLKMFELCIRNFETTYIAMIKELQEKTFGLDRKSTRLNSSHEWISRMPSSA